MTVIDFFVCRPAQLNILARLTDVKACEVYWQRSKCFETRRRSTGCVICNQASDLENVVVPVILPHQPICSCCRQLVQVPSLLKQLLDCESHDAATHQSRSDHNFHITSAPSFIRYRQSSCSFGTTELFFEAINLAQRSVSNI